MKPGNAKTRFGKLKIAHATTANAKLPRGRQAGSDQELLLLLYESERQPMRRVGDPARPTPPVWFNFFPRTLA
jgi:hypothetical protein